MSLYGHICGCYFITTPINAWSPPRRHYLPVVDVNAQTTILSTTSRTKLTQKFVVPDKSRGIRKLQYTFPLFDGVSVVGFECRVQDRIITGEVQEKEQAKKTFQEAVDRGEVAGLLEQLPNASDVFTTSIGNVPPGATVYVDITYLGELKHDAEVDGVRFTIPTTIAPRYGSYPGELLQFNGQDAIPSKFSVTVDTQLEEGVFIREMRSPSHPLAVSMGTISTDKDADPSMSKASATLSLDTTELDRDFVVQIVSKEFGNPSAVLETHPTIPGSRALMATLVPKFQLKHEKPEIVFVCDRSGSMGGGKIKALSNALKVFIKSLPIGVVFNICSFGSNHTFLWKKSQAYSQKTMDEAIKHVSKFDADYGGTEMYQPLKDTLDRRFTDRNLEVFVVTDGEIWNQQELFDLLNDRISVQKQPIRVFTLGIGDSVSHSLIEGVARAGNGFSQSVGEQGALDAKVVRMLKASLFPHISDYSLEINYEQGEDGFELVEKVTEGLQTKLNIAEDEKSTISKVKEKISLFDSTANPDVPIENSATGPTPKVDVPKLLQTPQNIPALFPFNRSTAYILMSPDTCQRKPKSVILRGTCQQGPLELEIPVKILDTPGQTIHQLAAKKAVLELEEGRGWLQEAKTANGKLIKEAHASHFDAIIRDETVRLGVQFQVGGKNCSFVAVEKKAESSTSTQDPESMDEDFEFLDDDLDGKDLKSGYEEGQSRDDFAVSTVIYKKSKRRSSPVQPVARMMQSARGIFGGRSSSEKDKKKAGTPFSYNSPSPAMAAAASSIAMAAPPPAPAPAMRMSGAMSAAPGGPPGGSPFYQPQGYGAPAPPPPPARPAAANPFKAESIDDDLDFGMSMDMSFPVALADEDMDDESSSDGGLADKSRVIATPVGGRIATRARKGGIGFSSPSRESTSGNGTGSMQSLISLQTFEGYWEWSRGLFTIVGIDEKEAEKLRVTAGENVDKKVFATLVAVLYLERRLSAEKDAWELIVDKAREWLDGEVGDLGKLEGLVGGLI